MFRVGNDEPGSVHENRKHSTISSFYTRSVGTSGKSKGKSQDRVKEATKISIVMSLPICAILIVTTIGVIEGMLAFNASKTAKTNLGHAIFLSDVVGRLQVERGLSAMYLSSKRSNQEAFEKLKAARERTDNAILAVTWWPDITLNGETGVVELNSTEELQKYILGYRERVNSVTEKLTPVINIGFYTTINMGILDSIAASISLEGADFLLVAFDSTLRAGDNYGILRAIGSSYYAPCGFPAVLENMFNRLNSQALLQKEQAFRFLPGSRGFFLDLLASKHPLEERLDNSTKNMLTPEYAAECLNTPLDYRFAMSLQWFDNMTSYMSTLTMLRNMIVSELEVKLDIDNKAARRTFVTSLLLMTLVTSVGLVTLRIVLFMTKKVELQAKISSLKENQLENEQKRTDGLLNQMMPKIIIEQLKENKPVQAEFFDSVTVYFSDIVGFTNISSRLQPHEVVQMLNEIYGTFDAILDKHDVYKVETIGDAYLVASGIPIRNGNRHASQVAMVALQISQAMKSYFFYSESGGSVDVHLRIGLHSGSCAAGVVGMKMPRYCIFGDALIIAQCMESSGLPDKIQVSSHTRFLLEGNKKFKMTRRHSTVVQGKTMETYWLENQDEQNRSNSIVALNVPGADPD